ncbi:MAG: three component ABC system middle component, partial [Candidatus Promineifilaceae bacterium]
MIPWTERPIEVATLLNPAFCGVLLHDAVKSYAYEQNQGMAFPLVYLILPLVLHKETRNALPSSRRLITLYQWVEDNKLLRQNFVERTRYLVPYSREGLIFSIKHGFVRMDNELGQEGYLSSTDKS